MMYRKEAMDLSDLPEWQDEVKTATKEVQLELSPGIWEVPPPELRTVFNCLKCGCQVATYYETVSYSPLRIRGRCGMCYRIQTILA